MRPAESHHADVIPAPAEKIFALLVDPQRMSQWLPFCRDVKTKSPGVHKGTRLMVTFPSGIPEFEVVDFQVDKTLGWIDRIGRKGSKTFIRLEFAGAMTRISFKEVAEAQGAGAWIKTQLNNRRDPVFSFRAAVQNLRKMVTA